MEPGRQLTHYLVEEKIGEGGMGEVWLAKDTRLQRDVAIKVLPTELAGDQERLTRFEREAKALAALNHPHIAQIFGVDQVDDICFLVLEMVPGETFAERIAGGPPPVEETLDLCRQIAEALEAAHDAGIIHRDLKPANVRITPEGVVKVLDFGLAKSAGHDLESGATAALDSDSLPLTTDGKVLGTPTYMSPEQARGKRIDRRTDIWAFGCMLFEALSGQRTFGGETITDVLGAIVHKEPDWDLLPPRTPTRVRELLRRCLSKDARHRLRDIGDARVELEEILADPTATMAVAPVAGATGVRKGTLALMLVVVAAFAAGGTWFAMQAMTPDPVVRRFRLSVDEIEISPEAAFQLSPDGTRLLYRAGRTLWIRPLHRLDPRELPDTKNAEHPFWSPDGQWVGFSAEGKLWRVPAAGGPRAAITALPEKLSSAGGAAWLADDTIVWCTAREGDPLLWTPAGGGDPRTLLEAVLEEGGMQDFHHPSALPDAKGVLVSAHRVGETNADTLAVVPLGAPEVRRLYTVERGDNLQEPCYSESGHILYRRSGTNSGIWALPFSLSDLEATGDPFLVVPDGFLPTVSDDGTLVHSETGATGEYRLVTLGRDGRVIGEIGEPVIGQAGGPVLSRGGDRITLTVTGEGDATVWSYDVATGARTRILFEPEGFAWVGAWLPGGDEVVALRGNFPEIDLVVVAADGSGTARTLATGDVVVDVTPDGKAVIVERVFDSDNFFVVPLDEGGEGTQFLEGPGDKDDLQLSPDGRFAVYESDESGSREVYLTHFPSAQGKWLVSADESAEPMWGPNGDEIFFLNGEVLMVVPVRTDGGVSIGAPELVVDGNEVPGLQLGRGYAISPDGERIVALRSADPGRGKRGVVLVQNWVEEFAKD